MSFQLCVQLYALCATLSVFQSHVKYVLGTVRDKNYGLLTGTTGKHSSEIN
jgi:hypothetical protein